LWVLFLLALAVRLLVVALRGEFVPPALPGAEAGVMAQSIAEGRGFVTPFGGHSPSTHLPPIYPLLLAVLYKLQYWLTPVVADRGSPPLRPGPFVFYAALAINLFASAWLPVLTAKLARAAGAVPRVAFLAGLLMCLCPESLRAAGLIWDGALLACCVCGMLLLMLRALAAATWKTTLSFGVLTGLLSLLNPAATLALLAAWLAGLKTVGTPWRKLAGHALLFCVFVLAAGVPWHIRNWLLLDPPAPVFVRGNFWLEVWTNLNPVTVTPAGPKVAHPWPANGTETLERDGRELTEQEYFAWCRQRSLARLSTPSILIRHVSRQVDGFWLGDAEANRWHKNVWLFLAAQGIPALCGLAGLYLARRQISRAALGMILALLVILPLPYYLAGGAARYRHPLDALLYLGIALLAVRIFRRDPPRDAP
jgi:hypothetical protein